MTGNFVSLPEALYAIDEVIGELSEQDNLSFVWVENEKYVDGLACRQSVESLWRLLGDPSCGAMLQLPDGFRIDARREWLVPRSDYQTSDRPATGRFVELSQGALGTGYLDDYEALPRGELVLPRRSLKRLLASIKNKPSPSHSHAAMVREILAAYQDNPQLRKAAVKNRFPRASVRAFNKAFAEAGISNPSIRKPGRRPKSEQ